MSFLLSKGFLIGTLATLGAGGASYGGYVLYTHVIKGDKEASPTSVTVQTCSMKSSARSLFHSVNTNVSVDTKTNCSDDSMKPTNQDNTADQTSQQSPSNSGPQDNQQPGKDQGASVSAPTGGQGAPVQGSSPDTSGQPKSPTGDAGSTTGTSASASPGPSSPSGTPTTSPTAKS